MADVGSGSRAGRGAAAGFVGEEAALGAVHDDGADASGHSLAKAKGFQENPLQDGREKTDIADNDKERKGKIQSGHDGHHDVENADGGVFSQDDDGGQNGQADRRPDGRNVKGVFKG